MNGTKPWYESTGAWANLMQMTMPLAVSAHLLTSAQAAVIAVQGPALLVMLATFVLGAWGLWGRLRATQMIKSPVLPISM